ncbi:MAG: hypothetical protein ACO3YN_12090, partial [Rubrivivax sp.]
MSAPSANPSIAVETILEDADFVAIAKPAGRVSEPGLGHRHDSMMNGAVARWGDRLRSLGEARDHGLSLAVAVPEYAALFDRLRERGASVVQEEIKVTRRG